MKPLGDESDLGSSEFLRPVMSIIFRQIIDDGPKMVFRDDWDKIAQQEALDGRLQNRLSVKIVEKEQLLARAFSYARQPKTREELAQILHSPNHSWSRLMARLGVSTPLEYEPAKGHLPTVRDRFLGDE